MKIIPFKWELRTKASIEKWWDTKKGVGLLSRQLRSKVFVDRMLFMDLATGKI